ncbi:uncharacterized protein [Nicotiana sylvestris]|uniref:uncharacterized protein n=1 Tax=Nicotiana sylvestris TaxID=4096 RepID=UPI00388CE8B9
MNKTYQEAKDILDEMTDTSAAWQSRANMPQGNPSMVNLTKKMEAQGERIAELTTTLELLAKNQIPRQVNAMDNVQGSGFNQTIMANQLQGQKMEALEKMPGYAKFMKVLVTKKKNINFEIVKVTHQCSAIISHSEVKWMEGPRAFTIIYTISVISFAKALCDLGASTNLMPYDVFKRLGLGYPRPTSMKLLIVDRTLKKSLGVIDDILIKVGHFYFPSNFLILDYEADREVPIIFGRLFLATGWAICDVEEEEPKFHLNDEEEIFHIQNSMT